MSISAKIDIRDIHRARHRLRNRVFVKLLAFFTEEANKRELTRRDFAVALDKDPAQITRWLSRPTNLTLDTIADLLNVVEADMEVKFACFADKPKSNKDREARKEGAALMPNDNWDTVIDQRSDALADLNLEIARLQAENAALAEELINAAKGVDYYEEVLRLRAENRKLREVVAKIEDLLSQAKMDDCENGVRVLNEHAAATYLQDYRHTRLAINQSIGHARAALEGGDA